MSGQEPIEILTHRDIREVEAAEWDSILEADDLQMSHRFVLACQESGVENARYWHLRFYRRHRLEAVACLSIMQVSLDLLSRGVVRRSIRGLRRVFPDFLKIPVLFCGLPVSFGRSGLRFRPDADKAEIVTLAAATMERIAVEEKVRILCFKEFFLRDLPCLAGLCRQGYFRASSIPFCWMSIAWKDFASYLADLRAGYRRHIRKAMLRGRQAGLEFRRIEDFHDAIPDIFRLYGQVMDRADFQLERLNRRFFEKLKAHLGSRAWALLARDGGQVAAAAVVLQSERTMTFLLAGIDYALNPRSSAYINLVIRLVAEAIQSGVQQLDLGQTSYFLKRSLGAETEEVFIFVRHRSPLGNLLLKTMAPLMFPDTQLPRMRVRR